MTLTQILDVILDVMDLNTIAMLSTVFTAIGVWLVPLLMKHLRRRREIKEIVGRFMIDLEYPPEKSIKLVDGRVERIAKQYIEKDVIKPLKTELNSTLKSTKSELFRERIEWTLYELGDKKVMTRILVRSKDALRDSRYLDDALRNTLSDIKKFKIVELAPLLFERLPQEKDYAAIYEIVRILGTLGYKPALPYILQLANEHVGRSEDNIISHACIMAIGDIALDDINALTTEELDRVTSVFTTALSGKDDWLIDAVVRVKLPVVLKRKGELRDPLKKKLMEALVELLNHNRDDIRENVVKRLIQLEDKRALPYLKKKLQGEPISTNLKSYLERTVQLLEGNLYSRKIS